MICHYYVAAKIILEFGDFNPDHQTAKFNSLSNFPPIQYDNTSKRMACSILCITVLVVSYHAQSKTPLYYIAGLPDNMSSIVVSYDSEVNKHEWKRDGDGIERETVG